MILSFTTTCRDQFFQSLPFFPATPHHKNRWARMDCRKEKLVIILGATGTGKSRLSVDLALRFPSEIVNADKIQLHQGLDITTNKIPFPHRRGIPHHLLGDFQPDLDLSPTDFRSLADSAINDITTRNRLPIIAGGSNSFIHALVSDRYEPDTVTSEFRYKICFLWVDVSLEVLFEYLSKRVEDMLDAGMFPELAEIYDPVLAVTPRVGLRKAIGVPEFDRYFQRFPPKCYNSRSPRPEGDFGRRKFFEEAVGAIKDNTCQLAKRQLGKILRLRSAGWDLRRMDGTDSFRAALASDEFGSLEVWKKDVMEPSVNIVKRFLDDSVSL
ncbi:adenylate isopentenyltransferase-like [Tasmannia lanceolata]|uniref:adenylate isopentenyltransferase-like n=1 Tax=Tasmannia lanceolata TaxID=3420 RepID=UPI0040649347